MKLVAAIALILVVALPVAAVGAILLSPFWSWLEASSGIESLGHSGPASWCYGVVYGVTVLAGLGMYIRRRSKKT